VLVASSKTFGAVHMLVGRTAVGERSVGTPELVAEGRVDDVQELLA
jgi:hypothetical protein